MPKIRASIANVDSKLANIGDMRRIVDRQVIRVASDCVISHGTTFFTAFTTNLRLATHLSAAIVRLIVHQIEIARLHRPFHAVGSPGASVAISTFFLNFQPSQGIDSCESVVNNILDTSWTVKMFLVHLPHHRSDLLFECSAGNVLDHICDY